MKYALFILCSACLLTVSCKKDDGPVYAGTVKINNIVSQTDYSATGLHFPTGRLIKNTSSQEDVMVIQTDFDVNYNVRKLYLSVNNDNASFFKYGEYPDTESATTAFKNLKSVGTVVWEELADTVVPNQVWLFRTSDDRYAKFRIVSTFSEKRDNMVYPYGEAVVEWVFQPDATPSFR
jgi:hypothetical protein